MENITQPPINEIKSPEKERLELLEKKIGIQKKRIEIKKEKADIDTIIAKRNKGIDEQEVLIKKVSELRYLLGDFTIDDERTIIGSEPFLKSLLTTEEKNVVIDKLFELIKKM